MSATIEELLSEAKKLPVVSKASAEDYLRQTPALLRRVDDAILSRSDVGVLTGANPLRMVMDNHRNHAAFMVMVFKTHDMELLIRTLVWVYRSYIAHGFSASYFQIVMEAWMEAVYGLLGRISACEILEVYRWMARHHDDFHALAAESPPDAFAADGPFRQQRQQFIGLALQGDHRGCMALARQMMEQPEGIRHFYLDVVQPAMEEIGRRWEMGRITVADEHTATAIARRVLAALSVMDAPVQADAGRVLITCAPDEQHELGTWMLADMLERTGWKVRSLGANTPANQLEGVLREFQPHILMISATMPFLIPQVAEMVARVKAMPEAKGLRIMVGGRAFQGGNQRWQSIGADAGGLDLTEALRLAEYWLTHPLDKAS